MPSGRTPPTGCPGGGGTMLSSDQPMQDVRAQYATLAASLATFQASVGDCLKEAEAEFLQAYRAHMVEVHRELQQLRGQLRDAEEGLRDDAGVRDLEAQGAWYRGEAAQQAAHVAALAKDRTYARRKRRALDADRRHLRRQLEAGKREQKRLEARCAAAAAPPPQAAVVAVARPPPRRVDFGKAPTHHDTMTPTGRLRADVDKLRGDVEAHAAAAARLRGVLVAERVRGADFRDLYASCAAAAARGGASSGPGSEALDRLGDLVFPLAAALPGGPGDAGGASPARAPRGPRRSRATEPVAADALLALDDDILAFLGTLARPT